MLPNIAAAYSAGALVILTVHWRLTREDVMTSLRGIARHVTCFTGTAEYFDDIDDATRRVDEAMDQLREESYGHTSKLLLQANAMAFVLAPMIFSKNLLLCACILLSNTAAYCTHLALVKGMIRLKSHQLRRFIGCYYILTMAFVWTGQSKDATAEMHQRTLTTFGQLSLFAMYVDCTLHVPGQIALAINEILASLASNGWQSFTGDDLGTPVLFACIQIFSALVLENTMRESLSSRFRCTDAESLVSSFRKMLRGVSDAEILLDDSLHIQDDSAVLAGLLSPQQSLKGQDFAELLIQETEEQERFQAFIARPVPAVQPEVSMPPCLRVSLRRKGGHRVGADLYHVRVPHLYGCQGAYHLFALKVDADAAFLDADVTESVCSTPSRAQSGSISASTMHVPSVNSAVSDCATGSFLSALLEFTELSIQIDTKEPAKVVSLHFNYQKTSDSHIVQPKPSLRMFIRPTQWIRVRDKIRDFHAQTRSLQSKTDVGDWDTNVKHHLFDFGKDAFRGTLFTTISS